MPAGFHKLSKRLAALEHGGHGPDGGDTEDLAAAAARLPREPSVEAYKAERKLLRADLVRRGLSLSLVAQKLGQVLYDRSGALPTADDVAGVREVFNKHQPPWVRWLDYGGMLVVQAVWWAHHLRYAAFTGFDASGRKQAPDFQDRLTEWYRADRGNVARERRERAAVAELVWPDDPARAEVILFEGLPG
jgi:hypothetical protein